MHTERPIAPPRSERHSDGVKRQYVLDPHHNNLIVAAFEIPAHWQASSAVRWEFQNINNPVCMWARAHDPQTGDAFERFPDVAFFWIGRENFLSPFMALTAMMYRPGQEVMGQVFMQPLPAADALLRFVIGKWRGNRPSLRVLGSQSASSLVQELNLPLPAGMATDGVGVRIEYAGPQGPMEEEFFALQCRNEVPYYGPQGTTVQTNWYLLSPHSFQTHQGRLDTQRPVLQAIRRSARVNPAWQQLYAQIMQQLAAGFNQQIEAGYQSIYAAGQLSRQISANNDAFLNAMQQQRAAEHAQFQAARHADQRSATDEFSDYLRGVQTYEDPYWGQSQHASDYQYVWTDGFGNYRYSNDPSVHPSIGDNINWQLMTPKPRGH